MNIKCIKFTIFILCLMVGIYSNAQVVVFDPDTYPVESLPSGMSIVELDGAKYLQVISDGWNSVLDINPIEVDAEKTHFMYKTKYKVGSSGFEISNILTFLKLSNSDNSVEIGAGAVASATRGEGISP